MQPWVKQRLLFDHTKPTILYKEKKNDKMTSLKVVTSVLKKDKPQIGKKNWQIIFLIRDLYSYSIKYSKISVKKQPDFKNGQMTWTNTLKKYTDGKWTWKHARYH